MIFKKKKSPEGHIRLDSKDVALFKCHWCYVTGVTVCPLVLNVVKNIMWAY